MNKPQLIQKRRRILFHLQIHSAHLGENITSKKYEHAINSLFHLLFKLDLFKYITKVSYL